LQKEFEKTYESAARPQRANSRTKNR